MTGLEEGGGGKEKGREQDRIDIFNVFCDLKQYM